MSISARRRAVVLSHHPVRARINQSFQTFNSLNAYIIKGDVAPDMGLTFTP